MDSKGFYPKGMGEDEMSDGITDSYKIDMENLEYLNAINTISKYIAERALHRPEELRNNYLSTSYDKTLKILKKYTDDFINAGGI